MKLALMCVVSTLAVAWLGPSVLSAQRTSFRVCC